MSKGEGMDLSDASTEAEEVTLGTSPEAVSGINESAEHPPTSSSDQDNLDAGVTGQEAREIYNTGFD